VSDIPAPAPAPIIERPELEPDIGIWGVRNYHTRLEQRAQTGAQMTGGYVAMVFAAGTMATAGLLLDSSAIVIGSMCVAPFLGPSRAVCIGLLFRDWSVFGRGLIKQLVGLLLIGSGLAFGLSMLLLQFVELPITHEILIRAMPTSRDVILSAIVAFAAGAAASLALVAQPRIVDTPWGQVIDAIIGVEIAISLIPPAAVIGIGLALGTPEHSLNAFWLLMLNVVALDLVGSVAIMAMRGVRREHLVLEKSIRASVEKILDIVPGFVSVGSTVDVTLLSEEEVRLDLIVRRRFGGKVPSMLAEEIAREVAERTLCRSDVSVEVVPLLTYSNRVMA
jgi:uncharacterized hydrophobic protein (TIGR00271 family)